MWTKDDMAHNLHSFKPRLLLANEGARAAVAVIVVDGECPEVVLTRRSSRLRAHPGQWALPGGRMTSGEGPEDAAKREVLEELGVTLGPETLLGRLDDYRTRSGYVISPLVFLSPAPLVWAADANEVAEVHLVPMEVIDVEPEYVDYGIEQESVLRIPFGSMFIHAPTGAILFQFREVGLYGRHTRIDNIQEPLFAWQ